MILYLGTLVITVGVFDRITFLKALTTTTNRMRFHEIDMLMVNVLAGQNLLRLM
jgi:hypothetical protein